MGTVWENGDVQSPIRDVAGRGRQHSSSYALNNYQYVSARFTRRKDLATRMVKSRILKLQLESVSADNNRDVRISFGCTGSGYVNLARVASGLSLADP